MLILVSVISCGPLFYQLKEYKNFVKKLRVFGAKEGDHLTMLNAYLHYHGQKGKEKRKHFCNEYKINEKVLVSAERMVRQLTKILRTLGYNPEESDEDTEAILRCLTTGYFMNAAQCLPNGSYIVVSSKETVHLHPGSILNAVHPNWIIFEEVVRSGSSGKFQAFEFSLCEISLKIIKFLNFSLPKKMKNITVDW